MTFNQLVTRLLSLVSLLILAAGIWLTADYGWRMHAYGEAPRELLGWGVALLAWSVLGGLGMGRLLGRGGDLHGGYKRGEGRMVEAPDGARLWVEAHGDEHAPALVLTHGWGLDSTVWREAKRDLCKRYRVIVWDLPGLGRSKLAPDGKITMERLAEDLGAVLELAHGPAVLVGHSIGGMIIQTFCRLHPEAMGSKVAGVVLEHTTHTDPVRTTLGGRVLRALEGPVLAPLLKLEIALAPVFWAMNWQAYLSGWMHIAQRVGGFGTVPCARLLDHVSKLAAKNSPAVQAKGLLAMMAWDKAGENTLALPGVRVESLTFTGGRDLVTKPVAGERLAALLGGEAGRLPYAGHYGPLECASWYDGAIVPFADQVFTKGAVWADRVAAGRGAYAADARGDEDRSWSPEPPAARM